MPSKGAMDLLPLTILLAAPRGFCAGVDRAIQIVERAIEDYGAPVYVRHEIVHNRFVVETLEAKGAVFVEELAEVPDNAPVVFSAHGVPKSVPAEADRRKLFYLDATCPLVSKVHREAERHHALGRHILLIGHGGHPEVIGTMGQLPAGAIMLVETKEQAESLALKETENLAYITQTTLSVDDTADIVAVLRRRFPSIRGPEEGGHLLRHDQPPGGGQGDRRALRADARDRRAELLQLAAPGRGGQSAGLPARRSWCSAPPRSTGGALDGVAAARHHRRRLGAGGAGRGGDRGLPPALRGLASRRSR